MPAVLTVWLLANLVAPFLILMEDFDYTFFEALGLICLTSGSIASATCLLCLSFLAHLDEMASKQDARRRPSQTNDERRVNPTPAWELPDASSFADPRVWRLLSLLHAQFTGKFGDQLEPHLASKAHPIIADALRPDERAEQTRKRLLSVIHPDNGDARFSADERQRLFQLIHPAIKLVTKKESKR